MVAFERSVLKKFPLFIFIDLPNLLFKTLIFAVKNLRRSISIPTPFAPYFLAAIKRTSASPQPRSYTTSSFQIFAHLQIASAIFLSVLHQGAHGLSGGQTIEK